MIHDAEPAPGAGGPSRPLPTTIEAVIVALDEIVDRSIATGSALGYFAALYARVTRKVATGIEVGIFEDGERMAELDVVFANRYLSAYSSHRRGERVTGSWRAAFAAEHRPGLSALQHLLLGMNAHINLDLGIAACEVARDAPMPLKADFMAINEILRGEINATQDRLARFVRPLRLVDRLLGDVDEQLSMFSIGYARDKAWTQTLELSASETGSRVALIQRRDEAVAAFARRLIEPRSFPVKASVVLLRLFERGTTSEKIRLLAAD
jgi:hypothetical protein